MDRLQEKAQSWQDKVFKLIVFLAILGCLTLSGAVYILGKAMGEITGAVGGPQEHSSATPAVETHH